MKSAYKRIRGNNRGNKSVMHAVSMEDVARLHAYLIVPMVVNEALSASAPLEGETQYGLHVTLSEIEPDSALLAIALSAQRIADEFMDTAPLAIALKMEANRIVSEYGPEWLANYHKNPAGGDDLYDLLRNVPEDLEAMAELLSALQSGIENEDHPAFTLCSVLSVQARAHMEIAAYVISELEADNHPFIHQLAIMDGVCRVPETLLYAPATDNIVLFPIHRRR